MRPLGEDSSITTPKPNLFGIDEVETVFSEVALPFFFVPFEHSMCCFSVTEEGPILRRQIKLLRLQRGRDPGEVQVRGACLANSGGQRVRCTQQFRPLALA